MPTSLACFDEALVHGIPETEQTFDSPDLFTHHPIQDGFQMHLKGKSCGGLQRAHRLWQLTHRYS
jgi:hypothetical protein